MPQPRDVLVQRTTGIEPTYALHVLDTLPPNAPPAITCRGLHQAIHHADALARERAVDIWYTEDVAVLRPPDPLSRHGGRPGALDASQLL